MRRVKRVIKKKDEAKKEEMRKEGEEYLRSKAMVEEANKTEIRERSREEVKVGPTVAEKQEGRVAKVVTSISDGAGQDEGLSMEEEAVLAREILTEKEKLVMSAVLSNRRSRSRSNSRMGERSLESPLPRTFLESPVPTGSGSSCTSSLTGSPESPATSPLPLVAEEQVDITSSQEDFSTQIQGHINSEQVQSWTTSGEAATDIVSSTSNVVRRNYQSDLGKNPDPTDNHSSGRTKNGNDVGRKCLIGKEARPEDVIIAPEKNKAPEKKKIQKEEPVKDVLQPRSTMEENDNNNNHSKETGNENVVVDVTRPKRQNVTKESVSKRALNGKLDEEKRDPVVYKEEENKVVEEIRDSVKDVRDILDRLSKKEEEEVKENIGEESVSMTDNAAEKSKECPVLLLAQKKEDKIENVAEVEFLSYVD